MPDFLTDFAHAHFAASPRQALFAAVIERWDPSALLQALGSGRPQLQRIAARKLQSLRQTPEFCSAVLNGLSASEEVRVGVLTALSFLPLPDEPAIRIAVDENLEHASHRVREAAARVIVFQRPERAYRVLPLLERTGAFDIARLLCLSDQPELIWPLLKFFGHPQRRPPPIIGMLVNPRWLAEEHPRDPDAVGWLIRECGYSDAPVTDGTILLLQRGFLYVSADMAADPRPDDWRPRVLEFCWNLLPEALGMAKSAACRVDLADPLDTALFLAAVRQADRSNLDELRSRDPFSHRTLESRQILVCSHAHAPYVRRQFVDGASSLAEELHVPAGERGRFTVEHGRVLLETDEEARTEAELFLRGKWSVAPTTDYRYPVLTAQDFPAVRRTVLREFPSVPPDPRLSAGSNAILELARYLHVDGCLEWLLNGEADCQRFLPPIGCELQVPLVDRNRSLAWKQSLRSLGIPSPRRPEYRAMVEAAFRPSASYHAMILGPLLLRQLGLIDRPQDMALHVSIQGDLRDRVRYLAFPQFLMRPSRRLRDRPESALTRVMSKGLVNCNRDVETCRADFPAECRTEIRVFRCFADDSPAGTGLRMDYIDDVIQTHLLAAAMLSNDPACKQLVADYTRELEGLVATLPAACTALLHANFYEATGDPRDAALLDLLPIIQVWRDVRQLVRERDLHYELEQRLLQFRTRFAREAEVQLRAAAALDGPSPLIWTETGCRIALPGGLVSYSSSEYFVPAAVTSLPACASAAG